LKTNTALALVSKTGVGYGGGAPTSRSSRPSPLKSALPALPPKMSWLSAAQVDPDQPVAVGDRQIAVAVAVHVAEARELEPERGPERRWCLAAGCQSGVSSLSRTRFTAHATRRNQAHVVAIQIARKRSWRQRLEISDARRFVAT